jgi:hypothetical protein
MQYILFDENDRPLRVSTPRGDEPTLRTMEVYGAVYAKPVRNCTQQQYEDAMRAVVHPDRRTTEGKRRRTAGHGYSGGDGMIPC